MDSKKCSKNNLDKIRERKRGYYQNNLDKIRERQRNYYRNNKEKVKQAIRKWQKDNLGKIHIHQKKWRDKNEKYLKEYRSKNRGKKRKYLREYLKNNTSIRLSKNFARLIRFSLRDNKNGNHWEDLVDYNLKELMEHLEKQFKPEMNWSNYGKNGWEIDHIKPISSFNFTSYNDREFKQCWSLNNLQPLWKEENISKGDKIINDNKE